MPMMYLLFLAEALEVRLVPVGVCGEEEGPHPHKAHAAAARPANHGKHSLHARQIVLPPIDQGNDFPRNDQDAC